MLKSVKNIDLKISGLRILSKIGEGGMSVVYLAEQISLKRQVAVKVMRLEIASNDLDVQRFKHEAKTIAQLDHPNIINIYNIGQTSKGEIFFTMPYLNHGDFSNYLLEDEQEFIELLKSICDGLSFAHDGGVVHRDIKPENLLFDEFGNVRIADFGIAISKEGARMTKEHQIVGSAQYMSPEQARSLNVDIYSDIYSLGIIIYERLTGNVPFDSDDSISILVDHVSMQPPQLPAKMRHWQGLIDKCLAKLPKDRFQSMVELKIALDNVPTNSLQRTNHSIQSLLSSNIGKHLKWFVPGLLVILMFAYFYPGNDKTQLEVPIKVAEKAVIQVDSLHPENVEIETVGEAITLETNDKDNALTDLNIVDQLESFLTIDQIRTELKDQQIGDNEQVIDDSNESLLTQEVNTLLDNAFENIEKYRFSKPKSDNAIDQLLQVLVLSPENSEAVTGLQTIGRKYFYLIDSAIKKSDFKTALKYTQSLQSLNSQTNVVNEKFDIQKKSLLQSIAQIEILDVEDSKPKIVILISLIKAISPEDSMLAKYEAMIEAKPENQIGDKLLDSQGVETVLVSQELAVTSYEISVGLYSEFANQTNRSINKCKHKGGGGKGLFNNKTWVNPYFTQNKDHPVVCISNAAAVAYASWLSLQTGNSYRLPTQNEWLIFSSQENNSFEACKTANVTGSEAKKIRNNENKFSCNDNYKFTAPVAQFTQNRLGLYDISGNVSEWVACSKPSCQKHIAMGSSWLDGKQSSKLDLSRSFNLNAAYSYVGFRLVRDL